MLHASRRQLGIGLALSLVATAMSGSAALAGPAPAGTTTASGPATILPPPRGEGSRHDDTDHFPGDRVVTSPWTGMNALVPASNSLLEDAIQRRSSSS